MNTAIEKTLKVDVSGPADAPVIVMLHGWPDDSSLWRNQVGLLESEYRCVVPTLPNYGDTEHELGGCDFPEIIRRLHPDPAFPTAHPKATSGYCQPHGRRSHDEDGE